ncbi:MAG: MarR family winged helix-turn-helix transcriptional regulator [Nocardioides sp.]
MVDDIDNPVVDQAVVPGAAWETVLGLLGGFRTAVDGAHTLLAARGHPDIRPSYGFALQAVGAGATASEIGSRLGVSKQAAAKTVAALERQGYVARSVDPADARRRTIVPTTRGLDLLTESARAFEEVLAGWRERAGAKAVDDLARGLAVLDLPSAARLDLGTWSG